MYKFNSPITGKDNYNYGHTH